MNLFDHIKLLRDCELFSDMNSLVSLALSITENGGDGALSNTQKFQSLVYYGDGLYHTGQYRRAEDMYKRALQLRKYINKVKGKSPGSQSSQDLTPDANVKYSMHLCQVQLAQYKEAMNVLESITAKHRTPKINLALAKLYHRTGMDRSAITSFKEVLRECPLAIDAVKSLLKLGVKGTEVSALVINSGEQYEWLTLWIKGHTLNAAHDHTNAKNTYQQLDVKPYLWENSDLLNSMGLCCFNNGDYTQALHILQKAHQLDPFNLTNTDIAAYLLYKDKKLSELVTLYNQLLSVTENAPEPWIAMGYFFMATLRAHKAAFFAQKALYIDSNNVFALLLKGSAILQFKSPETTDAVFNFREALKLAPHSFECHQGLIDCYIATHRLREAVAIANKAIKTIGANVRTLTLCGSVFAKLPNYVPKAKMYLERVLKMYTTTLEPVYILADIYSEEGTYDKAITILRNSLEHHNVSRLHQMLADALSKTNEQQEALEHYNTALQIDASNTLAREGLHNLAKNGDISYTADAEVGASENEVDAEGSESGWSDSEFT